MDFETLNDGNKVSSKERHEFMASLYVNGWSSGRISKQFKCSVSTVFNALRSHRITGRRGCGRKRIHNFDEYFFDNVDNEEKAYWLGFLTADGCVSGNSISLSLQDRDRLHLEKFRNSLHSDYPITPITGGGYGKDKPQNSTQLISLYMADSLQSLGVGERKSLTVAPCSSIPQNLKRHYLRGLVDGDGWISFNNHSKNWEVGLVGSFKTVLGFIDYTHEFTGQDRKISAIETGKIYSCRWHGNHVVACIVRELYSNSTIYLDRKKESASKVIESEARFLRIKSITYDDLVRSYTDTKNWYKSAASLGVTFGEIRGLRRTMNVPTHPNERTTSRDELVCAFQRCHNWKAVSIELGLTYSEVRGLRKRLNIPTYC